VKDHNGRDIHSLMFQHAEDHDHEHVRIEDFAIIGSGYQNSYKRKVSEAIFIKQLKPEINQKHKNLPVYLLD